MSKIDEIRAALANGYDSCPGLAKEDVVLLLAVVEAALNGGTPREMADDLRELGRLHTTDAEETQAAAWDALADAVEGLDA